MESRLILGVLCDEWVPVEGKASSLFLAMDWLMRGPETDPNWGGGKGEPGSKGKATGRWEAWEVGKAGKPGEGPRRGGRAGGGPYDRGWPGTGFARGSHCAGKRHASRQGREPAGNGPAGREGVPGGWDLHVTESKVSVVFPKAILKKKTI